MKKWMSSLAALCTALVLLCPRALAYAGSDVRILGADRIVAYWILGVCSVLFVTLVVIWSIRLKKTAKTHSPRVASQMQK